MQGLSREPRAAVRGMASWWLRRTVARRAGHLAPTGRARDMNRFHALRRLQDSSRSSHRLHLQCCGLVLSLRATAVAFVPWLNEWREVARKAPSLARSLFALRFWLGRLFGWDCRARACPASADTSRTSGDVRAKSGEED